MDQERPLAGGNTSEVVRAGDTVRRSTGAWTPAVHRLLRHLERVGFDGAPRVRGLDDAGREILEYVPGDVGTLTAEQPLLPWFRTAEACRAVGVWVKDFQAAQAGYAPDPAQPWRRVPGRSLAPGDVLVHHDVSPYNTVRRDDGSLVVLDWDFACPGDPLEDLAWAAWRWVPLMAGTRWHAEYGVGPHDDGDARRRRNLAALLEGYCPTAAQRGALAEVVYRQMTVHADSLEEMATTDVAFAALVDRGFAREAREDAAWLEQNAVRLGL
ncbi:aminoglycoside phosphotransferase family protein [Nocardioides acrostichi]|nr:aminoglycoside phosphotransferase family protein [Nocardioides acrostichi]